MKKPTRWYRLYHAYIFHEQTKVFAWMIAASTKKEAAAMVDDAIAYYYPRLYVKDFMVTITEDEAAVLV